MKEQRSQFLSLETIFDFKVRDFRAKNPNKSIGDAWQPPPTHRMGGKGGKSK